MFSNDNQARIMTITFQTPKTIVVSAAVERIIASVTIDMVIDCPKDRVVRVALVEGGKVDLWTGADYTAIGQWTDSDVVSRLTEILNQEIPGGIPAGWLFS